MCATGLKSRESADALSAARSWPEAANNSVALSLLRDTVAAICWVEEASRGTESVEAMTARLAGAWRRAIAEEAPAFGEAEMKWLELDVDLNAQGLAVVADAARKASAAS